MNRDRAFSAVLSNGRIAMVKVEEEGRSFWTLPGGGVEQVIKKAEWIHIAHLKDDLHVSRVIASLSEDEIVKYNIRL